MDRFARHVGRAVEVLGRMEEWLCMLLLAAIAGITALQIFARYVLSNPFIWPEEIAKLLLVWLSFLAAAAVTRRGAHIAVDTVVVRLPGGLRRIVESASDASMIGLFALLALQAGALAGTTRGMTMAATELPTSLLLWPLVLGGGLVALHSLVRLWLRWTLPEVRPAPTLQEV